MPLTRQVCAIHDDQVGDGAELAFPTMSTCAACIAVRNYAGIGYRLIGVHKTRGWTPKHDRLFQIARETMGWIPPSRVYILGWNVDHTDTSPNAVHSVAKIRTALNGAGVPTFAFDYVNATKGPNQALKIKGTGKMIDVCTFASVNPAGQVTIGIKRTPKVTVTTAPGELQQRIRRYGNLQVAMLHAPTETITTPSTHMHVLREHQELVQV